MTRTGALFSEPSLVEGIARLFDWGSTLNMYNDEQTSQEADYKALKSDWKAVGDDMRKAMRLYEQEQK